jgi:fatty acid desaturase
MPRDDWQVETCEHDNPARPVVLRTTLLPIGDVMLAIDHGWWRRASQRDRQLLLAEHRAAIAMHFIRRARIATLGGLAGAAAGAALAWVVGWPVPAVVPAAVVIGLALARVAIASYQKRGLFPLFASKGPNF